MELSIVKILTMRHRYYRGRWMLDFSHYNKWTIWLFDKVNVKHEYMYCRLGSHFIYLNEHVHAPYNEKDICVHVCYDSCNVKLHFK